MIEFEKWWNNLPSGEMTAPEEVWRAALEWALKNWTYNHTLPEDKDYLEVIKADRVKEELKS